MLPAVGLVTLFWMSSISGDGPIPSTIAVGHWKGSGRIAANWTSTQTLHFDLTISPGGAVSGKLGDATISAGHIIENSTTSRLLSHAQYQIAVSLEGPILLGDNIRESILQSTPISEAALLPDLAPPRATNRSPACPAVHVVNTRCFR